MNKLFLSAGIALVTGVISFFLSVAFLCIVLLVIRAVGHSQPDMSYAYKAAAPVALLALVLGFIISMVRISAVQK